MKHSYSVNSNERKIIPFYIACVAIFLSWLVSALFLRFNISLPWWVSAPSAMGIYGVIYYIFDQFLWDKFIFHKLGFVKTPNISGKWSGKLTTSFDPTVPMDTEVNIVQTWSEIQIILRTDNSLSRSIAASIILDSPEHARLTYQYQNDPKTNSAASMQIHYGSTTLTYSDDTLSGDYYSGRGRQNTGSIELRKITL